MLEADLTALFADLLLTVPVTFGSQSTRGYYDVAVGDRNAEPYTSSSRAGRTVSVRVRTAALTGLGLDKTVDVDNRSYRIVDVVEEDDGMVLRLDLQRA